ncbi:MAG: sugar ABC transporter substrate-binding protein [Spirochaetales bacterium]|jgi:ribose transport system substrate-binding protein|nr:sugar ABC transporter substrate-binding protein [Spirochaetales bacterium]
MKIRKMLLMGLILLTICGLVFMGCNKQGEQEKVIRVGYAPTTMNNPFWLAVLDGVKSVLEPQGVQIVTIDPQNDQSKMNDQIGDLLAQGIDALLVAPFDSTGIRPALVACQEAGVPVINFDTPVVDKDLVSSIIASDNVNAGVVVAKDMMARLPRDSKIAIIHSPSGQACIDRYDGFMSASAGYFNVVLTPDGKGDTGVTMPIAEDILQGTPDLKAFFAVNDPSAIGCIQAIAGRNASGILVYGVDGAPDAKKAIQEGTMTGTGAQSPLNIGKFTAETALKVINGQSVDKNIVVETFIINSDNLSSYNVDGWQ